MSSLREAFSQMAPLQTTTLCVLGLFVLTGAATLSTVLAPLGPFGILLWAVLAAWAVLPVVHLVVSGWPASLRELFSAQPRPAREDAQEGEA